MASLWAIGDIHGEIGKLATLLNALPRGPEDTTVFLGDYIDRGPDSAGVVRHVLAQYDAAPDRTVLLWGNHEDMAAAHFGLPAPSDIEYDAYDWFRNGGIEALESFGLKRPELLVAHLTPCPEELKRLFALLQPFYRGTGALSQYLFVHAGILPGQEPEEADGNTLLWVREDFLYTYDTSGRIIVHGHTPVKQVRVHPDKIGIDTGAVFGGPLTALRLPERQIYQADGRGRVYITDIPAIDERMA